MSRKQHPSLFDIFVPSKSTTFYHYDKHGKYKGYSTTTPPGCSVCLIVPISIILFLMVMSI